MQVAVVAEQTLVESPALVDQAAVVAELETPTAVTELPI
jgi:hypothetical protein